MRLYRLTAATLFRRKSWVICAFSVGVLPFLFQHLSMGSENPALLKPAIAQATWALALMSAVFWGFFIAAKAGESNARSGLGEYFLTTGVSANRQLLEMWLAVMTFLAPLPLLASAVCILGASPALPDERSMWIATNLQYGILFLFAMAPLAALAIAVASRFGSTTGFLVSGALAIYGLYGVGYLDQLSNVENNSLVKWLWSASPHYHFADPTERLRYKLGAIAWDKFPLLLAYFGGILMVYAAISRLVFRVRASA